VIVSGFLLPDRSRGQASQDAGRLACHVIPAQAGLSSERSDFYRFGYATLGLIPLIFRLQSSSPFRMFK
jgi:hypothetical protein